MRHAHRIIILALLFALVSASCGDDATEPADSDPAPDGEDTAAVDIEGQTITVMTHDSFAISDATLEAFTTDTGVTVQLLSSGDTGQMISEAILTAGNPLADVMFGVDNTFLQRALDADLFEPYTSVNADDIIDGLDLDPAGRVTPIDFGDVCVNYWIDALPAAAPTSLEELTDPAYADHLVVQSPETSSPGLAFLLATIAGTDDWEQYWTDLVDNGVTVTAGWEDAYYGEFVAGGGERSLVVSYASSPPAEVIFAAEPIDTPPTGVLLDSCFRQIEFAGILSGTEKTAAAGAFIDFMLTPVFQNDVPLSMFVFPATESATLPPEFVEHAQLADDPHMLDPAEIEANRDEWVDRWVEIVLG